MFDKDNMDWEDVWRCMWTWIITAAHDDIPQEKSHPQQQWIGTIGPQIDCVFIDDTRTILDNTHLDGGPTATRTLRCIVECNLPVDYII